MTTPAEIKKKFVNDWYDSTGEYMPGVMVLCCEEIVDAELCLRNVIESERKKQEEFMKQSEAKIADAEKRYVQSMRDIDHLLRSRNIIQPPAPAPAAAADSDDDKSSKGSSNRKFSRLHEALPFNTHVYVESCGDRWNAVFTENGFVIGDKTYKTPGAFCKAHASRITLTHLHPTKPGNGWDHVKIDATGKTIGEIYDIHFST